jgi:hypothetical protein
MCTLVLLNAGLDIDKMRSVIRDGYDYEEDLHLEAVVFLRYALKGVAMFWHTPNGARYDPTEVIIRGQRVSKAVLAGHELSRMGVVPGVPDFLILWQGKLHGIDAKSRTGPLSENQKLRMSEFEQHGGLMAGAFRTLEQLEDTLTGWGIPLNISWREISTRLVLSPLEAQAYGQITAASAGAKERRLKRGKVRAASKATSTTKNAKGTRSAHKVTVLP